MRIKDICSGVTDGSHNPPQGLENSDYLMLSSKNVFDDKITFDSPRYLSQIDFEQESKRTRIKSGDVLLTIVGTVGRAAVVGENMPQFTLQRSVAVLHPNVEICDSRYLMYALQANRNHIESRAKGVAQKGIYLKEVADIELQIPLLSEQTHRVKVLDKIAFVIKFHQKQLQKLDELVKARFVEMFGDPEFNTFGWDTEELGTLCDVGSSKRIYQNEQSQEGIPFWRISDLISKMDIGVADSGLFIPEERYVELKNAGLVPTTGDILVTSRGTLGRCYIIKDEDKFYFQDGMISWLSNYVDGITPLYLQYLFTMPGFRKQIDGMQAGSTVAYLSIAMLKKLRVMVPPIETQNCFALFVEQLDKSKAVEGLYSSLCL